MGCHFCRVCRVIGQVCGKFSLSSVILANDYARDFEALTMPISKTKQVIVDTFKK